MLRAILVDLTTFSFNQGASTITQQVVKNSILTGDKTPARKLKELVLSLKIEKVLTKEQIFSMYLNEISYGGNIYGVEEASRDFFNKEANFSRNLSNFGLMTSSQYGAEELLA